MKINHTLFMKEILEKVLTDAEAREEGGHLLPGSGTMLPWQ